MGIKKEINSFQNCDKCFGGGSKRRTLTTLEDSTNADRNTCAKSQLLNCNTHEEFENDKKDVDACAKVNGYLDFGEYLPGTLVGVTNNGKVDIKLRKNYDSVQKWGTAKEAMEKCTKVQGCCGITYSDELKWTMRNGGSIKSAHDDEDLKAVYGTVSYRKDCYQDKFEKQKLPVCENKEPDEDCKDFVEGLKGEELADACKEDLLFLDCLKTC